MIGLSLNATTYTPGSLWVLASGIESVPHLPGRRSHNSYLAVVLCILLLFQLLLSESELLCASTQQRCQYSRQNALVPSCSAANKVVKVTVVCRHRHGRVLADVMQEVPLLWEAMSPKCRAALGACNKQLSHMLHSCTRLIMLTKDCELLDTACGSGPSWL